MKIIKRSNDTIVKEEAHGGSGARKVIASADYLKSQNLEAMTYGYLPAGKTFDWHDHKDVEEIMVVLKGEGKVSDEEGTYNYASATCLFTLLIHGTKFITPLITNTK